MGTFRTCFPFGFLYLKEYKREGNAILFTSFLFLAGFPILAALYYLLPQKISRICLLAASWGYYIFMNPLHIPVLLSVTAVSYGGGLLLYTKREKTDAPRVAKGILIACICAIVGLLFLYKYWNFLADSITALLETFGLAVQSPRHSLGMPLGISFYSLQAISYLADIYRREIPAEKNVVYYALFLSFFPSLSSGPINRANTLLPQLRGKKTLRYENVKEGLIQMAWGYLQKIVVADRIGLYVDFVYDDPALFAGWPILLGVFFYGFQIYYDFAGYSNLAIGAAKVLGFQLQDNFRQPYLSHSIQEFWRRWHISFSSWLRDYVYIPLGGSRCSKPRKYMNLMITFLVSGLWHGANWNFLVWGGIHGVYQIVGNAVRPVRERLLENPSSPRGLRRLKRVVQVIVLFLLVDFAWIFFRAGDFGHLAQIFQGMFSTGVLSDQIAMLSTFPGGVLPNSASALIGLVAAIFGDFFANRGRPYERFARRGAFFQGAALMILVFMILIFGLYGTSYQADSFIYTQF